MEKISDVRSRLNMTWLQIWPIICYMEEQGILEKGKEGTVTLTRTPEQVEELVDSKQWKQLFGEEEAKRRSTGSWYMKKQSIISKPGFRTVRMNLSGW